MKLTAHDLETIALALSYAVVERESYADCGDTPENTRRAEQLVARFEKLNHKLFGVPTHHRQQMDKLAALPTVSLADLLKQQEENHEPS